MNALLKNRFAALVKREYVDHRNGILVVPSILGGLQMLFVVIAMIGVGSLPFDVITDGQFDNLPDLLAHEQTQAAAQGVDVEVAFDSAVAALYWLMANFVLVALPFVIFFSLLGSMYEERRDKSILFWKSMPVSDWHEAGAKLFASLVVAPAFAFGIMLVTMFGIAIIISIYALLLGVPVELLWPVGSMLSIWFTGILTYIAIGLWVLPLLAWVLLVSAGAPRMPFVFAALPPVAVGVAEVLFFHTTHFFEWIGMRFAAIGMKIAEYVGHSEPENAQEALDFFRQQMSGETIFAALGNSFTDVQFWVGFVVAGLFTWGAVELRKRANA